MSTYSELVSFFSGKYLVHSVKTEGTDRKCQSYSHKIEKKVSRFIKTACVPPKRWKQSNKQYPIRIHKYNILMSVVSRHKRADILGISSEHDINVRLGLYPHFKPQQGN